MEIVSCPNCNTQLLGAYCHHCGQEQLDRNGLKVGHFLRQFGKELISLDFKSVKSLAALFKPGYLAEEFLAGRRQRFLGPLKMYFLTAALFFFLAPLVSGFSLEKVLLQDSQEGLRKLVTARLAETHMNFGAFAARFDLRMKTVYTVGLGISAVGAALVLWLFFYRVAPSLGTHVVFSLYYVSFFYIMAIVLGAANEALRHPQPVWLIPIEYGVLAPYLFFALRRVYRQSRVRTLVKTFAMLAAAFAIDIPINIAAQHLAVALT